MILLPFQVVEQETRTLKEAYVNPASIEVMSPGPHVRLAPTIQGADPLEYETTIVNFRSTGSLILVGEFHDIVNQIADEVMKATGKPAGVLSS